MDPVRALQHALYRAAKADPGRRFHTLSDKVYRRDVLERAWVNVRRNGGAAGIDRKTIADVQEYGVARLLDELVVDLKVGRWRPQPARRVFIPKPGSRELRPLSIPTVRDRIVQAAMKIVLEPILPGRYVAVLSGRCCHHRGQRRGDPRWCGSNISHADDSDLGVRRGALAVPGRARRTAASIVDPAKNMAQVTAMAGYVGRCALEYLVMRRQMRAALRWIPRGARLTSRSPGVERPGALRRPGRWPAPPRRWLTVIPGRCK